LVPLASRSRYTQWRDTKDLQDRTQKLKTLASLPVLKQTALPFIKTSVPIRQPSPKAKETEDNGAKELILDALIGEACGDNDALEHPISIKAVFDDVTRLLANKKQAYAPRIFFDLLVLKQYTA
jgi:hypothetical protein